MKITRHDDGSTRTEHLMLDADGDIRLADDSTVDRDWMLVGHAIDEWKVARRLDRMSPLDLGEELEALLDEYRGWASAEELRSEAAYGYGLGVAGGLSHV